MYGHLLASSVCWLIHMYDSPSLIQVLLYWVLSCG